MAFNNLNAVDSIWFNTIMGHFGLVLAEDTVTGERKLYGGVCSGLDQTLDEMAIMAWGNKVNAGMLQAILNKVTAEGPEVESGHALTPPAGLDHGEAGGLQ